MIIDVGANNGEFILDVARKNPKIQCLAIEPIFELAENIKDSAKLENLENIEVVTKAVSLKRGNGFLNVSTTSDQGGTSLLEFDHNLMDQNDYWSSRPDLQHSTKIEVSLESLDGILRGYPKDIPIEFIKIDVQGLDLESLLSLKRRLKYVLLGMLEVPSVSAAKLYKGQEHDLRSCLNILRANNFTVYAIKPNDPASNEFNVYFARNGSNHEKLIVELGLMTNSIYSGKWFWLNPSDRING